MLSVIIPMYNEKTVIASSIRTLTQVLEEKAASSGYEIIISDDGSTDGCGDVARECARSLDLRHGTVRVITAEKNAGKGAAVRMGMAAAEGDILLFTDSDLAYGCDCIVSMANALENSGSDILIGSRAIHPEGYAGYTFLRKLASRMFLKLLALGAGFSHTDSQCGIKAFRKDAAKRIFANCTVNGWAFDFEVLMIASKMGYSVAEYPVTVINHRESKINLVRDAVRMMKDVRRIRKRINGMKF